MEHSSASYSLLSSRFPLAKGNDGKGFCPGAQREWIKGKPIPAHVPFRGLPPPVKGGQAALISQMLMSATGRFIYDVRGRNIISSREDQHLSPVLGSNNFSRFHQGHDHPSVVGTRRKLAIAKTVLQQQLRSTITPSMMTMCCSELSEQDIIIIMDGVYVNRVEELVIPSMMLMSSGAQR